MLCCFGGGGAVVREEKTAPLLGYKQDIESEYELGEQIGKGGNGTVRRARHRATGVEYAVKAVAKVLDDPLASQRKRDSQLPYLRREVNVLLDLRGTLNVASFEEVFEDSTHVFLVMELCTGGELLQRCTAGGNHSERSVASYLRAVLRTLAQCHAKGIIHRDVKPENFVFQSDEEGAPLKAIDFGIAIFFDPGALPIKDLNPEGTPWYLAPEVCRGRVLPASDVWAAGVMAAYLLTGHYPFIDRARPDRPDLAATLRSICHDELNLKAPEWDGISSDARGFVGSLLDKDPLKRPTAAQALKHPWLAGKSGARERGVGKPLSASVVQRIQRFAQSSVFKRTVLEQIAAGLVEMHFAPDPTAHGGSVFADRSVKGAAAAALALKAGLDRSVRGGDRSVRGDRSFRAGDRSFRAGGDRSFRWMDRSVRGGGGSGGGSEPSVHGGAARYLPVATPFSQRLADLFDAMGVAADGRLGAAELKEALRTLGFQLSPAEAAELFNAVDVGGSGGVGRAELSAGLLDWKAFQDTYKDRWLESVQRVFESLDTDGSGTLSAAEIRAAIGDNLSAYEVDAAVHQALMEAVGLEQAEGGQGEAGIDFSHFMGLLQSGEGAYADPLECFDGRLSLHPSRQASGDIGDMTQAQRRARKEGGEAAGCGCFG